MTGKNLYVLGAGAWGTALAISAARSCTTHAVWLCTRKPEHERAMTQERENQRYLPGHRFPVSLRILEADFMGIAYRATGEDLVIIATPMAALRGALSAFAHSSAPVVWLCKGFEQVQSGASHGLLGHEIQAEIAPQLRTGVLSGPSFAQEVAAGQPTALVAASQHQDLCQALVSCLHGGSLRIYANDDVVGVEVGGAVKNVLAIAAGLCDGMQLGMNARAALITRGLAEMTRLGLALSARSDTFMGLSGLGDLVLTATGDLSRNRKVGQLLASGLGLQEALASLGHVAEGVYSAKTVLDRAQLVGVDMPITQAVVDLLDGRLPVHEAVRQLMGRQARSESLA